MGPLRNRTWTHDITISICDFQSQLSRDPGYSSESLESLQMHAFTKVY